MKPKVCILAAGIGSRLGERSRFFNKALLRIGNTAAISYYINECFDKDTEYVIAVGYQGDIVKQYIKLAHSDKNITFVETEKWSGPGAGAGYALLQCEKELQQPFYFVCCDSIILEWNKFLNNAHILNWIITSKIKESEKEKYCTIQKNEKGLVCDFFDKSKDGTCEAFTGVAFIKDYQKFFEELNKSKTETTEIRDTPALFSLELCTTECDWVDIGTEEGLKHARQKFKGINNLDKLDEELYLVENHIIKYFYNPNMVKDRMMRVNHLNDTIPKVVSNTKNFYKYEYVEGKDLFKLIISEDMTCEILNLAQKKLWSHTANLNKIQTKLFKDTCRKFYYDKTISRLKKLYEKLDICNDLELEHLFKKINWDFLSDGVASKFHGDFNFSNIVMVKNDTSVGNHYKFLDWRQNFGDFIEFGDTYYDLSKFYHAFLFPHPIVKNGKFYIKKDGSTFIEIPYHIEKSKDVFEKWVVEHNYDLYKIKLLTAIVLLNMSPLHESPIDKFLYIHAKNYLSGVLRE